MSKKTKAFLYNLLGFAFFFIGALLILQQVLHLQDIILKLIAFVIGTVLAPKFQAVPTQEGEKLFMKWLFVKGVREL